MASATALPTQVPAALLALADSAKVRILNPPEGAAAFTSAKRARRFVRNGRAHYAAGKLVFHGLGRSVGLVGLTVSSFSGCDAFPGRAVLPPSPSVLSRMGSPRALRHPVAGQAT